MPPGYRLVRFRKKCPCCMEELELTPKWDNMPEGHKELRIDLSPTVAYPGKVHFESPPALFAESMVTQEAAAVEQYVKEYVRKTHQRIWDLQLKVTRSMSNNCIVTTYKLEEKE